jgi:O-antigen ligase
MSAGAIAQDQIQNRLRTLADGLAAAVVVSLPWSTSATAILVVVWLLALVPTLRIEDLREAMTKPAAWLPALLVVIAALGMLWADATWSERIRGLSGFVKLLVLPPLFIQFGRSAKAHWVLTGFLVSCSALLLVSSGSFVWPKFLLWSWAKTPGIPVKDYLIQAALFIVSAFILLYLAREAYLAGRRVAAIVYAGLAAAFVANLSFVATSRTALLTVPVLLALFAVRYFRWKGVSAIAAGAVVLTGLMWTSSDYLRLRLGNLANEVRIYQTENQRTSAGERIEFWKKSVGFVAEAPLFGHGTGSTRSLFARVASGGDGVSSLVSTNPHNQFLAVAVQIGLLGGGILVAMWIAHAMLFRGEGLAAWAGLVVVTQNVFGSLFNSHISDFSQGWLYVFGVGVAGGLMMARQKAEQPQKIPAEAAARA